MRRTWRAFRPWKYCLKVFFLLQLPVDVAKTMFPDNWLWPICTTFCWSNRLRLIPACVRRLMQAPWFQDRSGFKTVAKMQQMLSHQYSLEKRCWSWRERHTICALIPCLVEAARRWLPEQMWWPLACYACQSSSLSPVPFDISRKHLGNFVSSYAGLSNQ